MIYHYGLLTALKRIDLTIVDTVSQHNTLEEVDLAFPSIMYLTPINFPPVFVGDAYQCSIVYILYTRVSLFDLRCGYVPNPFKILPFFSLVSVGDGSRSSFSLPLPVAGIPPHNLSFMLVLLCSSLHWVFIQSQLQDSCTHPFALTIGGSRSLSSMHTLT